MRRQYDRSFGTVAVAASVIALGLTAIYWTARIGFLNPLKPVLETLALSLFLINTPYVARLVTSRVKDRVSWATSYSAYWIAVVLLATIAGRVVSATGVNVFPAFAIIGVVAFAVTLIDWLRSSRLWRSIAILVGSAAFSIFAGGVVWGRIYKSPIFTEMLSVNGIVHHDPLSLAAVANMLRTYHVPTPGLDGIPYLAYHWGTPWMFVQLSELLGTEVLDFYNHGYVVTMLPLFFGAILCFATEIRCAWMRTSRADNAENVSADIRENLSLAALFLIASIGIFPITGMDALGVWTSNPMISESYGAGLPVALLLFSTTIVFWTTSGREAATTRMSISDWVFVALVLPIGLLTLGYLKLSLMVLGLLAMFYAAFRKRLYTRVPFVVIGLALLAGAFLTYRRVALPEHNEGLSPFDFLKGFVPPSWWVFFPLVHLFWSWAYIALRVRGEGAGTMSDLRGALKSGRLLDAEVVLLIALAGVAPGLIIHIDGGSAFYFSDIQRWVSLGLMIAGAGLLFPWREAREKRAPGISLSRIRLRSVAFAFLAVPLLYSFASNSTHWARRMVAANIETRREIIAGASMSSGARGVRRLSSAQAIADGLDRSKNHAVLAELQSIATLPRAERAKTALFIPQTETKYWSLLARPGACSFSGHLAPALTGMAMVDGMPAFGCTLSRYYGLGLFTPRAQPQQPADTLPATLCRRVSRYGIDRVMTLHFDSAGRASRRVDECQRAQ